MKQKNPKNFPNSKIQNLFMCKREIQKLRQKVLGLIEQPCEDFQWCKRKVINVKNKQQPKIKSKSKIPKDTCNENKCLKVSKQVLKKQKKDCPCKKFWSQQTKKIENEKTLSKNKKQKIKRNSQTKEKSRHETRSVQSKFFNDQTPKSKKLLQKLNLQTNIKPSILVDKSCQVQAPLTVRKSINNLRYLNTESTVDNEDQKKLHSPHSVLLYSRTQRVNFQDNDDLNQSFLLSQKSNANPQDLGFSLKNSLKKSLKSKSSLIRIEKNQQKDQYAYRNPQTKQEESLNFSPLNSKYWKKSLRQMADLMKSQAFRKINETNLLQSQKQNDKNFINHLQNKNLEKSDLTTSWTLGNSCEGQTYKKPLNLDLIKKICQKTQKFMNEQIYPFRQVLQAEDDVQIFLNSLEIYKSINAEKLKKHEKEKMYKLWIDE